MDVGLLAGLVAGAAMLVLVWPAVRRAGAGALPVLLFWVLAIAAVTLLALLVERWQASSAPHAPAPVLQRGAGG